MQGLIAAFNAADMNGAILSLLLMLIAKYAVEIASFIGNGAISLVHKLEDRADETAVGKLTDIDNRIFEKICEAIEATMPIAEDFKRANEDGKLTQAEIDALKEKAWNMFVNSLGVRDWLNFGLSYIPNFKPKSTPKYMVENRLKDMFADLHVKAVADTKEIKRLEPEVRAKRLLERRFK